MSRNRAAWLLLLTLLSSPLRAQQGGDCCRLLKEVRTLKELGSEYRRLRRQAGSTCCDRFDSGLMNAMSALRDSLQPGTPVRRITALMGRPNLRTSKRYGVIEPPPGAVLLVYHWRGAHDFLYFVVSRGRVARGEWYHAWE